MRNKKITITALSLLTSLLLIGCGSSATKTDSTSLSNENKEISSTGYKEETLVEKNTALEETEEPSASPETTSAIILTEISASVNGEYFIGDTLSAADFKVVGTYSDGHTEDLDGFSVSPLDLSDATNTIMVSYQDYITTVTVNAAEKPAKIEAYKAYLDILTKDKNLINSYDWMYEKGQMPRGVSIEDINGDDVPELIYLKYNGNEIFPIAILNIYTYKSGQAVLVYSDDSFDEEFTGSAICYSFFKMKNQPNMYMYSIYCTEDASHCYEVFNIDENGVGSFKILHHCYIGAFPPTKEYYSGESNVISQTEYESQTKIYRDGIDHFILLNYNAGDFYEVSAESTAKTVQEAIDYLKKQIGGSDTTQTSISDTEWKKAYQELLSTNKYEFTFEKQYGEGYHVVDFDNDGIPEIALNTNMTMGPDRVYYYDVKKGKADETGLYFEGGSLYYIPDTGVVYTTGGRQGIYHETIARIKNGEIEILYDISIEYSYTDGNSTFSVNGKNVTETEYKSIVEKNVPEEKRVSIYDDKNIYTYEELMNYLK